MRPLTDREKRTVRIGAAALAAYLVLFFGWRVVGALETRRSNYQQLVIEAQRLRRELQPYENRALLAEKFKQQFHLDPSKLSKASLVAEASAAIQKAATSGGIQLGPIRESPGRSSGKELTSMQLEGTGQVPAVMTLLHQLELLGYPLIIDTVQLNPDAAKPGVVKMNLTIVILDFDPDLVNTDGGRRQNTRGGLRAPDSDCCFQVSTVQVLVKGFSISPHGVGGEEHHYRSGGKHPKKQAAYDVAQNMCSIRNSHAACAQYFKNDESYHTERNQKKANGKTAEKCHRIIAFEFFAHVLKTGNFDGCQVINAEEKPHV